MLALWSGVVERNTLVPPSKVHLKDASILDSIYRTLVSRFVEDLPHPLPGELFDPDSARACGRVVATALKQLQEPIPLTATLEAVPPPLSPAAHVTQAAILWHAVPVARRLRSEAFKALNRDSASAEWEEAGSERLGAFLAERPLLSMRADTAEFFIHDGPPILDGLRDFLGLRRWLVQRLADPAVAVPRQVGALRHLAAVWPDWAFDFRDILSLRHASGDATSADWLVEFIPLLDSSGWPEDLAPALRARARTLKGIE